MTKINRSTYQKIVEENKRLLADIETLTTGTLEERLECTFKWREHFRKERDFLESLMIAAKNYKPTDPRPVEPYDDEA